MCPHSPSIAFELGNDKRIYVQATLNGDTSCHYRFLLDTGASGVVLNSNHEELMHKIDFTATATNKGANSIEQVRCTSNDQRLRIGNQEVGGLRFTAIPYPKDAWDGVAGLDFLNKFEWEIDYDKRLLYVYAKGTPVAPPNCKGLSFYVVEGVPVITISVWINGKNTSYVQRLTQVPTVHSTSTLLL